MKRIVFAAAALLSASPAYAGMPFVSLTDVANQHIEAIGFFVALLLLLGGAIRGLWAVARADLSLPAPSYATSLAFVVAVALLLQVVLTMISGARELMTPGAWVKQGATYKLQSEVGAGALDAVPHARAAAMERLRDALWRYAAEHDGKLPSSDVGAGIPDALFFVDAGAAGPQRVIYVGGASVQSQASAQAIIVAYEPSAVGPHPLVLKADGSIEKSDGAAIDAAIRKTAADVKQEQERAR